MKPLPALNAAPIFAHESTALYRRVRELHAFAADLETTAGTSRYYAALVHIGLLAMFSTASAGVAITERIRARHLAKLRDQLARFASALRSMVDRGLIKDEVSASGTELLRDAESLIHGFSDALLCFQSPSNQDAPPSNNSDEPTDKLPFQDESDISAAPTHPLPKGARRVRHVDVPAQTWTPTGARADHPRAKLDEMMPMNPAAHNDERSVGDPSQPRSTNRAINRRSRAS